MEDQQGTTEWAAPGGVSPVQDPPPAYATQTPAAYAPPGAALPPPYAPPASPPIVPPQPYPAAAPTYRSWQPGIMPLRPLGFGDYLSLPFKAMRYNRAVVLGGPLLFTLIATLATAAFLWLLFTDPSLALLSPTSSFEAIEPSTVIVGAVALIAMLLADLFSSAVVAPAVGRAVLGERIPLGRAWAAVRARLGSLLLLYVITSGTMLVVVGLAMLPLLLAFGSNDAAGLAGLGVTSLLWLLAVPVVFLITLIGGLARPIVVLERRGAVDALRRATRLIKGRFWWSVLILFVASAIVSAVSAVLQQIGTIGAAVIAVAAPDSVTMIAVGAVLVVSIGMVVSYVLTYAYLGSLLTFLHIDLRIRHEGFDLTLAEAAEASRTS